MTTSHLLIVDDEQPITLFLSRILEREGYRVQTAADGRTARELLVQYRYEVLLTDIKMEFGDGIQLLQEAKAIDESLAVILFTGYATVDTAVTALQHGADNYLLKPVNNKTLIEAVQQALHNRQRRQKQRHLERLASEIGMVANESMSNVADLRQNATQLGALTLDHARHQARLYEEPLPLTPTEYRLLVRLADIPGHVRDYQDLVQHACGYHCLREEAREIIGTHVRNLRRKLDTALQVESVRGIGYRIVVLDP